MRLTEEQQALLDGKEGEAMARVMKTLVMYGEAFGAERMVPVTSACGHLVTSFGLSMMTPVYALMDQLIEAGAVFRQKFTMDPRPLDKSVPSNFLQNAVFRVMYSRQASYEQQLKRLGLRGAEDFTCTCYMEEVGNVPAKGEVLSWAESSAVVYANSVLGARCNRNSGIIELFGSIAGYVPEFGFLTDEGRKADWVVEVRTAGKPEAQLLGSAIGKKVLSQVPYIKGLDRWIGTELTQQARDYLKDMGAATASNGAVGLYHVENLTPEAKELGEKLLKKDVKTYVIDDAELQRVRESYPVIWKDKGAFPKLAFVGCPHLSLAQLKDWTGRITEGLREAGKKKVCIPTVLTAAPAVAAEFRRTEESQKLSEAGVVLSSICPLMYMNNPLCAKMPVITCSNKLRTYSTARFYTEDELVSYVTKGGVQA